MLSQRGGEGNGQALTVAESKLSLWVDVIFLKCTPKSVVGAVNSERSMQGLNFSVSMRHSDSMRTGREK